MCVELPEEDAQEGQHARLKKWLHGMRGPARGCEDEYTSKVVPEGFLPGKYAPAVFVQSVRSLRCEVYDDDFTFAGLEEGLLWAAGKMKGWYEVKVRGALGPDVSDTQEIDILNRRVRWTEEGS